MSNSPEAQAEIRAFLIRVAELLHRFGTPAHRLERVMGEVSARLGETSQYLATPTSLFASFGEGSREETHLLRVGIGEIDLGKLVEFDEVMESVESGQLLPAAAMERLDEIEDQAPRWPGLVIALSFGLASAGAARFFGGNLREVLSSFGLGLCIALLSRLVKPRQAIGLFEPLAALLAGLGALVISRLWFPMDDRLVTLASLIALIPGLTLTVGLIELTTEHLVSGTARLAGAATILLTILFGVAFAWTLGDRFLPAAQVPLAAGRLLPPWTIWLGVVTTPFAFAVLLSARAKELPIIFATGIAGYLGAQFGILALGDRLAPFLGALVVGLLSNLYARVANRPSLVPMTPGILLLVPGSLGYRSLTSFLHQDSLGGMEWAFQCGMVAVSLVAGLLAAGVLLPPRRVL